MPHDYTKFHINIHVFCIIPFTEQRNAEIGLCAFVAEHNESFMTIDHLVPAIKKLFHDSQMKRKKCSAIVKNVLGQQQISELIDMLHKNPFSICIDESTDRSCAKVLCIICRVQSIHVTYSDEQPAGKNRVRDIFFALEDVADASAAGLYKLIVGLFNKHAIDYKKNLVGFAADGANTMTGEHNSVARKLKEDCPQLIIFKCVCHLFATCMSKACRNLPQCVENVARDIYNYIGNSPKRSLQFKEIQQIFDEKPYRILKLAQTRWLSLEAVSTRILERYSTLIAYFSAIAIVEDDHSDGRAHLILTTLENISIRAYFCFLTEILPLINDLNKLFQSEKPLIHVMQAELAKLISKIMEKFLSFDSIDDQIWTM